MQIPADTQEFAINMSNMRHWAPPVQRYIDECLAGRTARAARTSTCAGWPPWWPTCTASCAAAASSCTRDARERDKPGKLRLMYEANPMAFIVEQAGGAATDGSSASWTSEPGKLHQRVSVVLGSKNEVERVTQYHLETDVAPRAA